MKAERWEEPKGISMETLRESRWVEQRVERKVRHWADERDKRLAAEWVDHLARRRVYRWVGKRAHGTAAQRDDQKAEMRGK